jgi:5-methylcytosine-specific restriction endonuclease McrBC regulatory subunit McrC
VWEDFLTLAARLAFAGADVRAQSSAVLGTRTRMHKNGERVNELTVKPDITLGRRVSDVEPLVLDAKYRTRADLRRQRIDEGDIYESLAFARAMRTRTVALLYPAVPTDAAMHLGFVIPFETIRVDDVTIHGLQVDVRGISGYGALRRFSSELRRGVADAVQPRNDSTTSRG